MQSESKNLRQIIVIGLFSLFLLCAGKPNSGVAADGNTETNSPKQTLVIGKVTENPKKHYRYMKPIADYVVGHMKDLGIREAKVLMAKDIRQMASYLKQDKVDWVTETCFPAVILQEKADAEILLRKWKKGVPEYHTIFFTRQDSGIDSLDNIQGKTIAFEDPGSTTAYFIPAWILLQRGYKLVQMASVRETPGAGMVGFVFSEQEINSSTWTHRGLVDLGALSNLDWEKDDHMRQVQRKEMKIIFESKPFPRAIELVRKNLDPAIKLRLKTVLLAADKDPKAQKALKAYQKTKKFDELDERGWAALEEARQILHSVRAELE